MRGAKYIGVFAACGFILSFFAGLSSHSHILSILLKALIFAIIFGALGFGIVFVFNKFLYDGNSGDFSGDVSVDNGAAAGASPAVGQHVDITIQDEELAPSESDNHFVVGENHQMLTESDMKASSRAPESNNSGFVPLRNFETVSNFSGNEAVAPSSVGQQAAAEKPAEAVSAVAAENSSATDYGALPEKKDGNDLDTLPDMETFAFGDGNSSEDDDDVTDTDTDSEFVSSASSRRKSDDAAEVKDAALMAKAISSVLSNENSM